MIFLSEFIFFLVFIIHKLYSLLVKNITFSVIGGKLNRYIENLKNITCSFNVSKNKKSLVLNSFFGNLSSWYKQALFALFVSTDILILKIAISYDFLVSNVLFINIFNKNFDIASLLCNNYIIFKIFYYLLFYFFIFCIVYKFYSKFYLKRKSNKVVKEDKDGIYINLGKYEDEDVFIKEKGLYQNILITGSIGSGKTSCAISNILDGFFKNNFGGLVIDIKGNYISQVKKIARKYNREKDVTCISLTNDYVYNPLNDKELSSFEMASIIKKVLFLISKSGKESEPFWLDKAEEYIRDFITLIRAYNNNFVNFKEIHNLVIDKKYLEEKLKVIKFKILNNEFLDNELFKINSAILNIRNDYLGLDSRTFGIIRSEITRMTSIFLSDSHICNKFCGESKSINFLSNHIYVLSLDISNNDKLSKIIATYLKLQFQRQILNNNSRDSPVFFVCDEYQEICNFQDANFFSLSREYKCINVISMQSYSSLVNSLKDEYLSNVVIQNFINKIWFRNDDDYTVKRIISQLGKEKIISKSKSYSENGKNARYDFLVNRFISYKSDFSQSYSENETIQNKYNEDFFTQELRTFEAMGVISDGNKISLYEKIKMKRWEDDIYENTL